jgi:hypothetical protein
MQYRMSRLETGTMFAGIIACVGNNTLSTADPVEIAAFRYSAPLTVCMRQV